MVKLVNIGRSSNGRTEAFEAFNLGSIPSLPALDFSNLYCKIYHMTFDKSPVDLGRIELRDIKVDINKPGVLLHGTSINNLQNILREGIKVPKEVKGRSYQEDHVSLSMVISSYEDSSASQIFGGGKNQVSLVIDPKFVEENKDKFIAVGKFLKSGEFPAETREIEILQQLKFESTGHYEVYWDEVLSPALPPEAVVGVICSDTTQLEKFKDRLPQRPLIIYDTSGTMIYEVK